jgi:dTDP-4-amino-4,6-dideoxygalactose transaminase
MTKLSTHTDPVALLDVSRGNDPLREQFLQAIADVVQSGRFVFGPDCTRLEASLAELCGVKHAVGCASGSDALLLALMALDITAGDEVICPSFTFFATASCITRLGAKPVFVDIDRHTYNIDPALIEAAITPQTKAIIPVHLFGQCADMGAIGEIAQRHELAVVEDVAQAIAAEYQGQVAGSFGEMGCFSFYPTKNLGGFGDGGMLTTNDDDLAARLRVLRGHGMEPRYYHSMVGINSRLDSIQAAALNVKMPHLDRYTTLRETNAQRYDALFAEAGLAEQVSLPVASSDCRHVWNQYTVRVPGGQRDSLRAYLQEHKIGAEIYYPLPLHQQECFAYLGYQTGDLPVTEQAAEEVLALPIYPELTAAEQERVVAVIGQYYQAQRKKEAA